MPRRKNADGVSSALRQVQKQAQAILVSLRKEIRAKEQELLQLRNEEANLGRLTGSGAMRVTAAAVKAPAAARTSATSEALRASALPKSSPRLPAGLKVVL
jgi:hypothetical protein